MRRWAFLVLAAAALCLAPHAAQAASVRLIYSFCSNACNDGDTPSGLVMDRHGVLYGTTTLGGKHNHGVVFQLKSKNGTSWKEKALYSFCAQNQCADGDGPTAEPMLDTLGNIYGTTSKGGRANVGTAFELVKSGKQWTLKTLTSICSPDDCVANTPRSGLSYPGQSSGAAYDGFSPLFGIADAGTMSGKCKPHCGTVFEITNSGGGQWSMKTIYDFCAVDINNCSDGFNPQGDMLVNSNGTAVTGTVLAGAGVGGAIYQLTPGTPWKETITYAFCKQTPCDNGSGPGSGVTPDAAGHLLGQTAIGGNSNAGVAYKIAGTSEQVLYKFCQLANCADGRGPSQNPLLIDSKGNLYGATIAGGGHTNDPLHIGGGTLFKLTGSTLQTAYAFCAQTNCIDGAYPLMPIAVAKTGKMYGIVTDGGAFGAGAVYEWTP